jgi:hypothetical protein
LRYGLILALLIATPCRSQTTTTGHAETAGPCSPAVSGNNNQFNINCQGITKEQGAKILKILNEIIEKEVQGVTQLKGRLTPASDPTPPNMCAAPAKGEVIIFIGSNGNTAKVHKFPHVVLFLRSLGPVLSVDREKDESIDIIMDVRSTDGKIIARLNRDGFVVNQNNYLEMKRPDEHSLIVVDQYGTEVLNVRYLNRQAIKLTGVVNYPGRGPINLDFIGPRNICSEMKGADGVNVVE